jgi:transcriptional regulator with XRE-family HTH domain
MNQPHTWRELLGSCIEQPQERQRIAAVVGVSEVTLGRWVNGETRPRSQNLHRLLLALPQHRTLLLMLLEKEDEDLVTELRRDVEQQTEPTDIPSNFYKRVLHTLVQMPKHSFFLSLCDLILLQALEQLDPQRLGLAIIIARCMPPSIRGNIHSLREVVGRGNPPWRRNLEEQAILLGAESLTGYAVISSHLEVNQQLKDSFSLSPGYRGPWEESATAAPILRANRVAGSLLVSSTQSDYFTPTRCQLVESYAELLAVVFADEDFYELERIDLWVMPPYEEQQRYLSTFRKRVYDVIMQANREGHMMTVAQAEQAVWQQIEQQLLQPPA